MASIDKAYQFLQFQSNKDQSGFIRPSQFNLVAERAQYEWVMERYGNPHQYQPGNPVPKIAWQATQKISDDLRFLLKTQMLPLVGQNGVLPEPSDYLHISSFRFISRELDNSGKAIINRRPVDIVRDAEVGAILDSVIMRRRIDTYKKIICAQYSDYFQFYPETVNQVEMTYLRKPTTPVWGFTVENERPVYDASTSVDFEVPEDAMNEIVANMGSYLGMNLRENEYIQFSEMQKREGV